MVMRLIAFLAASMGQYVGIALFSAAEAANKYRDELRMSGAETQGQILRGLGPILEQHRKAARIYYASESEYEHNPVYGCRFPRLKISSPSKSRSAVGAVRSIFRNARDVVVAEDRPGVITITIGKPSGEILKTRIPALTLSPEEQYNAPFAVLAIDGAAAVEDARVRLRIGGTALPCMCLVQPPDETRPHLPNILTGVTMDEALDLVATTFGTTVTYGECSLPDQYTVVW